MFFFLFSNEDVFAKTGMPLCPHIFPSPLKSVQQIVSVSLKLGNILKMFPRESVVQSQPLKKVFYKRKHDLLRSLRSWVSFRLNVTELRLSIHDLVIQYLHYLRWIFTIIPSSYSFFAVRMSLKCRRQAFSLLECRFIFHSLSVRMT